jgi:putative NADH-flavin reductase
MRVVVIGATGRTGRLVVAELLRRGHETTALVRDPNKLDQALAGRVRVVTGDSRGPTVLATLIEGADAVISALGPTNKETTLHRDTATALAAVMRTVGVRRFIGISGAGIDVPGDDKATRDKVISTLIRRLGGKVVADKPAEYRVWAASDLDWTLVRPPRLRDGPATGHIEHDAHRSTRSTTMTRGDLAVFLADVLDQGLYPRAAPFAASATIPVHGRRVR